MDVDGAWSDRPAAASSGSTERYGNARGRVAATDALGATTETESIRPYLPDLAGVVPGIGTFTPCPWGMGPEMRGDKRHWMGDGLPTSFGHFGMSGSLMLLNVEEGIGVVATSTEDFGPWAGEALARVDERGARGGPGFVSPTSCASGSTSTVHSSRSATR